MVRLKRTALTREDPAPREGANSMGIMFETRHIHGCRDTLSACPRSRANCASVRHDLRRTSREDANDRRNPRPRPHQLGGSANGHWAFPIQNLPHGVFSPEGGTPRGGVAIGEKIFDISAALEVGLFSGLALEAAQAASGRSLNAWLECSAGGATRIAPPCRRIAGQQRDRGSVAASGSPAGCCMMPRAARCICRRGSATSRIFSPAFITPIPPARSAGRKIR